MEELLKFTKNIEVEYNNREYIVHADNYEIRSYSYDDAINKMILLFQSKEQQQLEFKEMKAELEKHGKLVFKIIDQVCSECSPPYYYTEATLGIEGSQIVVKGRIDSWDENALYNQLLVSLYDLIDLIALRS